MRGILLFTQLIDCKTRGKSFHSKSTNIQLNLALSDVKWAEHRTPSPFQNNKCALTIDSLPLLLSPPARLPGVVEVRGVRGVPGRSNRSSRNETILNGVGCSRRMIPLGAPFVVVAAVEDTAAGPFATAVVSSWPLLSAALSPAIALLWTVDWGVAGPSPSAWLTTFGSSGVDAAEPGFFGKFVSSMAAFNSLADNSSSERFIILRSILVFISYELGLSRYIVRQLALTRFLVFVFFFSFSSLCFCCSQSSISNGWTTFCSVFLVFVVSFFFFCLLCF